MSPSAATRYSLFVVAALIVTACAVTHQSLWIDEGNTAVKALQPSLGAWWTTFVHEMGSDLQMPGYMLFVWGWEKIFGPSEFALRAANIPFFVGGVVALAWGLASRRRVQIAIVALALTNAFLWYYLSEARPYIVLFGFASITAACLFRLVNASEECLESATWFHFFCAGIIGLCATSLIAVPWALGAISAVVYWSGLCAAARCARRCKVSSALMAAALGGLGLYYLWTLQLGARASDVGRTGLSSSAFIFYELLGVSGLGPGRLELRANGPHELIAFLPLLVLGAMALLALLLPALVALGRQTTARHTSFILLAVALPFVLVLFAGVFGHMRLLGRHLTPLLPFLLALLAFGLARLLEGSVWKRGIALTALAAFLFSALEIRLAPRFRRDDYRTAAAIAQESIHAGQHVWWLADVSTGVYYHVPFDSPRLTITPDLSDPKTPPDVVVFSKPDIYDASGSARPYLQRQGFTVQQVLPAFEILTRPQAR